MRIASFCFLDSTSILFVLSVHLLVVFRSETSRCGWRTISRMAGSFVDLAARPTPVRVSPWPADASLPVASRRRGDKDCRRPLSGATNGSARALHSVQRVTARRLFAGDSGRIGDISTCSHVLSLRSETPSDRTPGGGCYVALAATRRFAQAPVKSNTRRQPAAVCGCDRRRRLRKNPPAVASTALRSTDGISNDIDRKGQYRGSQISRLFFSRAYDAL